MVPELKLDPPPNQR